MINRRSQLKLTYLSVGLALGLVSGGSGCSLTATRPVQEMANAEVAIKAAKDLNADSLVPELYRGAVENYSKAKNEYRLKEFDQARLHAVRAMRLAEKAEFEAYRMGGATPEATKLVTPEGSSYDAETAFREYTDPSENSGPVLGDPSLPPETKKPSAPQGEDYNLLLERQNAEREAAEKARQEKEKEKEKEGQKPSGATGPGPVGQSGPAVPNTTPGSLQPGAVEPAKNEPAPAITPLPYWYYDPPQPIDPKVEQISDSPIENVDSEKQLGEEPESIDDSKEVESIQFGEIKNLDEASKEIKSVGEAEDPPAPKEEEK